MIKALKNNNNLMEKSMRKEANKIQHNLKKTISPEKQEELKGVFTGFTLKFYINEDGEPRMLITSVDKPDISQDLPQSDYL